MRRDDLAVFRKPGVRCVALKRQPIPTNRIGLREPRLTRLSRVIKREIFGGFQATMRAARVWRWDVLAD